MAGLINSSINDTISKFTPRGKNGYGQITDNIDTLSLGELKNFATSICNLVIGDFPTFNQYMYSCMYRLMLININEKDITLNTLGANAYDGGDSRNIGTRIERPPYAEEINYLNFADKLRYAGGTREYSTREKEKNNPYFDYDNLYLDDTNKGTFTNKWATNIDRNSILYKTKRIFNENKANTIISQFGTNCGDGTPDKPRKGVTYDGQIRTQFGESHGRNLLTRDAEYNGIAQNINGYMNPYCRVWTHHHKMDRYSRAMRPFDGDRDKIHHWEMFNIEGDDKWGWKSKQNDGWQYSVMNKDTGFINITPSYQNGGGNNNIHSKQCMFSIENLAWKDYDPYAFDQCLSWEQRGPMGGRIMWFPPYDLQFSETASAQWTPSSFIGRGEDVYTYTNSTRTGTLSFIMLTDHPSITDYVTWYQPNDTGREGGASQIGITQDGNTTTTIVDKVKDTDWLRFFAGCDKDTIFERAVPTPLTDEGMQIVATPDKETVNTRESKQENVEEVIKARVYVFYPNNYSGQFDRDGVIDPIVYLLAGRGCQKNGENDIPIDWNDNFDPDKALGYEMGDETVSYGLNVTIEGNTDLRKSTQFKDDKNIISYDKNTHQYDVNNPIKWYYRIDGEYKPIDKGRIKNTYDQQLVRPSGASETTAWTNPNYWDVESLHLNTDINSVKKNLKLKDDEEVKLYTLVDFAYVYAKLKGYSKMETYLKNKFNLASTVANTEPNYSPEESTPNYSPTDERNRFNSLSPVDQILTLFDEYELVRIETRGNAPNDGIDPNQQNDTRLKRNNNLAQERSCTLMTWLKKFKECSKTEYGSYTVSKVPDHNQYNNNGKENKSARYAYADLTFKKSSVVTTTVNVTSEIDVYNGYMYYADDEEGHKMYKDKEGRVWVDVNGKMVLRDFYLTDVVARDNDKNGNSNDVKTINMYQSNKLRYDQEYHFYKKLERDHPAVWTKLTDKLKYFDPAFHSMTPEGFNARLTFLNQCVRQGNTLTMSDNLGSTANNLAFGRAPYCVLRVGDFYNQMIVIDSINIDYKVSDGLQWDLNDEGIGVQPMLARVSINFKFIGGGDLAGPVRRLQNAMSFNYYANTRLYDNRADRMVYHPDERAQGGGGHDEPDKEKSYAYVGRYYDEAAASAGVTSTLSGTSGKEKAAKTMDFKEFKAQTGLDKYKDNEDVIREISKYTGVGMNEIEKMIDEQGKVNMDDYSPFADYYNNNNSPSR